MASFSTFLSGRMQRIDRLGAVLACMFLSMFLGGADAYAKTLLDRLSKLSGADIMSESLRRHELYPYVYEEQTLVLIDAKQHRDVRRIQRYSRLEPDGAFNTLIKFIYPETIAGASLLFKRSSQGQKRSLIYLPALGVSRIHIDGKVAGGQILGSEFSIEDITPEDMQSFHYHRLADIESDEIFYFVVLAQTIDKKDFRGSYTVRKLLIRQDNFFITHIDYIDHQNRLMKKQTRHDMRQVNGEMWRADIVMMENYVNHHRSILKIDRRVYSIDYVPESMFEISLTGLGENNSQTDKSIIKVLDETGPSNMNRALSGRQLNGRKHE